MTSHAGPKVTLLASSEHTADAASGLMGREHSATIKNYLASNMTSAKAGKQAHK